MALAAWLSARARGRSAEQLRGAVESPKAVEGTAAAASALGFAEAGGGALTGLGERFALADEAERRSLLRGALLEYGAYREMLGALAERGAPAETEVRWIEAWWSTRGYGSSESNRREGAAAFGRLADFAGLGEYVPGRRGRPTRIRWSSGAPLEGAGNGAPRGNRVDRPARDPAPDLFTAAPPMPAAPPPPVPPRRREGSAVAAQGDRSAPRVRGEHAVNRITVPLSGDALARIEVPLRLPPAEKRRLLDLLELLISEE